MLSPDGGLLAGADRDGNILILPLSGGPVRRIPVASADPGKRMYPAGWTADSRSLFIHGAGELPSKIQKLDLSTGLIAPWKEVSLQDPAGVARIYPVRVTRDGRSWAYGYIRVLSNLYVVEGLK